MKNSTLRVALGFFPLIAIAMAGACRFDSGGTKSDDKRPDQSSSIDAGLSLEQMGSACGQHLSIGDVLTEKAPSDASLRGVTANLAVAICGTIDGSAESKWTALGMQVNAPFVYLRKPDAAMEASEANKALVYVNDKNEMIAVRADGKQVKVGKAELAEQGDPIELAAGVSITLAVRGEAYVLGKFPKDTPDSDRQIWVASSDVD